MRVTGSGACSPQPSLGSLPETSRNRAPEMDGGVEILPVLNCVPRVRTELGFDQSSNQGVDGFCPKPSFGNVILEIALSGL